MVPVSEVQHNLRTEAEVLGRGMRTDEGEKLLAFILFKAHRGCFRTMHGRLPEMDGMRAEDGGILSQPGGRLKSNFFLPRCTRRFLYPAPAVASAAGAGVGRIATCVIRTWAIFSTRSRP